LESRLKLSICWDADYNNNSFVPPTSYETIELTKQRKSPPNPMQLQKEAEKLKKKNQEEAIDSTEPGENNT